MKAEIIASGTELLLGEIIDTNTPFIADQLAVLGIDLYYSSIVGDNYERFLGVLKQAQQRSDIIIVTGGLGPTKGDITREVIAGLIGEKMEIDHQLKERITRYFTRVGLDMPENNLKQATLIPSAVAIPNPLGTAPGWWVEKDGKIIISLPGPPGEMQPMWQKKVFPKLERKGGAVILSRTLKSWGLAEARIDQLVSPFMSLSNPTLALYAKTDGIHLRITAKAANKETADKLIIERETELREILKDYIWGSDDDTLEVATSQLIISKGLTLAVAESFTGGSLISSFANTPESRHFLKGGFVAFDDESRALLDIGTSSPVQASHQTATSMATAARKKLGSDIGIAIDCFLEKQNGNIVGKSFIAVSLKKNEQNIVHPYSWRPNLLVKRSVMHAIFNLRKVLLSL